MTYDVEVLTDSPVGWATDMTVAGRHGRRRAVERAAELDGRGVVARVLNRRGERVEFR